MHLYCFDYSRILFKAIGCEQIWADRVEKPDRKAERKRIVEDIENGKPVIAMNLRIAPEWGVITGFLENGKRLLCRTYFDSIIFDEHKEDKDFLQETGGYLETDCWPYLIIHFGEKQEKQTPKESLIASMKTLIDSFYAPQSRGYYQGKEAYIAWINGLKDETAWTDYQNEDGIFRRLTVNDYMLLNLIDARRCAGIYLKESIPLAGEASQELLTQIADSYTSISQKLNDFRNKVQNVSTKEIQYNAIKSKGVSTYELRQEQINLLEEILELEEQIVKMAERLIEGHRWFFVG